MALFRLVKKDTFTISLTLSGLPGKSFIEQGLVKNKSVSLFVWLSRLIKTKNLYYIDKL